MKRKSGYVEVRVTFGGATTYLVTRSLKALKECFPNGTTFRVLGPWDAPKPVLDDDGAYRRPIHASALAM
jgi:hypothetical protein